MDPEAVDSHRKRVGGCLEPSPKPSMVRKVKFYLSSPKPRKVERRAFGPTSSHHASQPSKSSSNDRLGANERLSSSKLLLIHDWEYFEPKSVRNCCFLKEILLGISGL